MTPDPYTVTPETSLEQIVDVMERRRIKRLPVIEDGKLPLSRHRYNRVEPASGGTAIPDPGNAVSDRFAGGGIGRGLGDRPSGHAGVHV
jgi:CBS domain-containing protein